MVKTTFKNLLTIFISTLLLSGVLSRIPKSGLEFLEEKERLASDSDIIIQGSVYYNENEHSFAFVTGVYDESAPAYGTYKQEMGRTGWDTLAISSYQGEDKKYSDEVKAYAMGFLEAHFTYKKIWNHFLNCNAYFNGEGKKMPENVREFLSENKKWIHEMHNKEDPYWHHAMLIFIQYEGLIDAYNSLVSEEKKITIEEAMIMNSHDISELNFYKVKEKRPAFHLMISSQIEDFVDENSHCSGLIKIAPDYSDIWFGHNTWTSFGSMTRIFKEYRYKSNNKSEKARTIAMSSYPGAINSIDDFYITDRDLYVTETTNSVFKTELYDLLTPQTLLVWQRVMIANRLADNGKDWTDIFSRNNSGTYNNMFQILDLKLVDTDKKEIYKNALWIIEQIPGYTESADVTDVLRYGYWPSYNTAFFKTVRAKAGYDDILKEKPELRDSLDYHSCARANIFRRDQASVVDMESYKHIMRYNRYQKDPFSKNNPTYAIASRKDLDTEKPDCRGATDAKLASIKDIKGTNKKKITIISGPTTDDQQPFDTVNSSCISANKGKYAFHGLPEKFTFGWTQYETTLFDSY